MILEISYVIKEKEWFVVGVVFPSHNWFKPDVDIIMTNLLRYFDQIRKLCIILNTEDVNSATIHVYYNELAHGYNNIPMQYPKYSTGHE